MPGRPCSICNHPHRKEIDIEIAKGTALAKISADIGGSESALRRHRDKCLASAIQDLVISTAMDTHTAQLGLLKARELTMTSLEDLLLRLDENIQESQKILVSARDGVEVDAYDKNGRLILDDEGKPVRIIEGADRDLVLKSIKSINETLKLYFDLFREHREQGEHDLEKLKAEQEKVLKIIREVISPHPKIADELARRFEEEGLM